VRHEENQGVFSRDDIFQVVMLGKRNTFVTTLERKRNWSHQTGETKQTETKSDIGGGPRQKVDPSGARPGAL